MGRGLPCPLTLIWAIALDLPNPGLVRMSARVVQAGGGWGKLAQARQSSGKLGTAGDSSGKLQKGVGKLGDNSRMLVEARES